MDALWKESLWQQFGAAMRKSCYGLITSSRSATFITQYP
jgi:hypothetical protein